MVKARTVRGPRQLLSHSTRLAKSNVFVASTLLAASMLFGRGTAYHAALFSAPSTEHPVHLSAAELDIYSRAHTLVDWTLPEIKAAAAFHKLHLTTTQDKLPFILAQVGAKAAAIIADFRNIACDERVYSEWNIGTPIATWREMGPNEVALHFLYIILPRPPGDPQMFTEYRASPKGSPVDLGTVGDLRLITTNFTGSWSYFSSSDQEESRFRYFGEEPVRRQLCYVVGFAQKPAIARNLNTFEVGKHSGVILVQGLAWIDEKSFHIVKIETSLLAPRNDIGLASEDTTVNYVPVLPAGLQNGVWLPKEVTVLVHYQNLFVRNTHRYSGFKLFEAHAVILH